MPCGKKESVIKLRRISVKKIKKESSQEEEQIASYFSGVEYTVMIKSGIFGSN